MARSGRVRLRQHRTRLREQGCRRLEVTVGGALIARIRELAQRTGVPTWEVVEDALLAHLARHSGTRPPAR